MINKGGELAPDQLQQCRHIAKKELTFGKQKLNVQKLMEGKKRETAALTL